MAKDTVQGVTVRELIKELQNEDQDRLVVLAKDAEGNGYSPVYGFWVGNYADGEAGLGELTEEDQADGLTEEDIVEGVPALILSPM